MIWILGALAAAGLATGSWWWFADRPRLEAPPAQLAPGAPGSPHIDPLPSPQADLAVVEAAIRRFLSEPPRRPSDPKPLGRPTRSGRFDPTLDLPHAPGPRVFAVPSPPGEGARDPAVARLEALAEWLQAQKGVAAVRVPGGQAEGVRAHALQTCLPAKVPVHLDLWVHGPSGGPVIHRYSLVVEMDGRAQAHFVSLSRVAQP